MHLHLSFEEMKEAVAQYLRGRGLKEVIWSDVSIDTHEEGENNKRTVFDGITVDMDNG